MPRQKSSHVDSATAVGRRIRALREAQGLRQADISFEGCSIGYISRIESGERIPSLQLLREIGKRLGVSADYLATGADSAADPDEEALTEATLLHRLGERADARAGYERLRDSAHRRVRAEAILGLAELALDDGLVSRAVELLDERLAIVGEHDLDVRAVECYAHAHACDGDLAGALAVVAPALARATDHLDRFRLLVLHVNVLIDLNQLDEAERATADLLEQAAAAKDPIALARSLWSQSRLQSARGNQDLAARYAAQALAAITATEHEEYAARAHQLLAYIEIQRGNPVRALELLDEALPLIRRTGDATRLALFQLDRARALSDIGESDQARMLATDLALRLEGLSPVDTARTLSILADILAASGDTARALVTYEAAVDSLGSHASEAMLSDIYRRWTNLLAEDGQTERALEIAQRALNRAPDRSWTDAISA